MCLIFLMNSFSLSLYRLDLERDVVLLSDELVILFANLLHLKLVLSLFVIERLVI